MLIATGVLIALVLAVMTGTTVHVHAGPRLAADDRRPASTVPLWANRWLGLYATWEGIARQLGALLAVVGSYVVARELQARSAARTASPPRDSSRSRRPARGPSMVPPPGVARTV